MRRSRWNGLSYWQVLCACLHVFSFEIRFETDTTEQLQTTGECQTTPTWLNNRLDAGLAHSKSSPLFIFSWQHHWSPDMKGTLQWATCSDEELIFAVVWTQKALMWRSQGGCVCGTSDFDAGDQSSRPVTELRSTTNRCDGLCSLTSALFFCSSPKKQPPSVLLKARLERINKHTETHVGVKLDWRSRFNWKLRSGASIRD